MFDSIVSGVKKAGRAVGGMLPNFDPGMAGELMAPSMPSMPGMDPTLVGEMMPQLPTPSMGPIAELLSGLPSLPHVDPSLAGELMAPGLGGGMGGGFGGIAELMGGMPSMPDIDFSQAGELMGAWPF